MRCGIAVLAACFTLSSRAASQPPSDTVALVRAVATVIGVEPGGSLVLRPAPPCPPDHAACLAAGDWGTDTIGAQRLLDTLASALGTRRATDGESARCGASSGRASAVPEIGAADYLIVIRAPQFAGDSAIVNIGRHCARAARGAFAMDEVLVFRRGPAGWVLVRRQMTRIT